MLTRKSHISGGSDCLPVRIGRHRQLFRFERKEHLKSRKEIKEVFGRGKRYNCEGAKLFVLKNNLQHNRICFALTKTSKKSGVFRTAVSRNRAKRLGREAYRLLKPQLSCGYDLILLVFHETNTVLSCRQKQLKDLFSKAGILME